MGILSMSLNGTVIIIAILILRRYTLNRLPKRTFTLLWELCMLRLIMPFSLSSRVSIYNLAYFFGGQHEQLNRLEGVFSGNAAIPPKGAVGSYNPLPAAIERAKDIPAWLIVYLVGIAVCVAFFAVSYIMLLRRFRFSTPCDNPYVTEFMKELRMNTMRMNTLRSKRRVDVRYCEFVSSPLTYGLLKPTILLPKSMEAAEEPTLAYILSHELTHIARRDNLRKLFAVAVLSIHWFNPAVWVLYILYNRDIELCCDESVIKRSGYHCRSEYAETLIALAEKADGFSGLTSHFSGNSAEERIISIMKAKKTTIFTMIVSAVIIFTMSATLCTSAAENIAPDSDYSHPETPAANYEDIEVGSVTFATVISGPEDDTLYYSTDGEHFEMCPKDFLFGCNDIEWWTYDEYKKWLEEEKVRLQAMLGMKGWTKSLGDFVWTQEMIDEAIAMYEEELQRIKDGCMLSKPLPDGTQIFTDSPDDITVIYEKDSCEALSHYDTPPLPNTTNCNTTAAHHTEAKSCSDSYFHKSGRHH